MRHVRRRSSENKQVYLSLQEYRRQVGHYCHLPPLWILNIVTENKFYLYFISHALLYFFSNFTIIFCIIFHHKYLTVWTLILKLKCLNTNIINNKLTVTAMCCS